MFTVLGREKKASHSIPDLRTRTGTSSPTPTLWTYWRINNENDTSRVRGQLTLRGLATGFREPSPLLPFPLSSIGANWIFHTSVLSSLAMFWSCLGCVKELSENNSLPTLLSLITHNEGVIKYWCHWTDTSYRSVHDWGRISLDKVTFSVCT